MHDPFQLTCDPTSRVSTSDLESFGRRASLMFTEEGTPLNEAIVKIAEEHPTITSEQVQRVVEFANRATFQEAFEKKAGDKNIEFSIADPNVVLAALNEKVSPPVIKMASDYYSDPVRVDDTAAMDRELEAVFGTKPDNVMEKVASEDGGHTTTYNDHSKLVVARSHLQKQAEVLGGAVRENDWVVKEAQASFQHELRQHLLEGGDLTEVVEMMGAVAGEKLAAAALKDVQPEIEKLAHIEKISLEQIIAQTLVKELVKEAEHRIIDEENPLVQKFAAYITAATKQAELEDASKTASDRFEEANALFQEAQLRR